MSSMVILAASVFNTVWKNRHTNSSANPTDATAISTSKELHKSVSITPVQHLTYCS